MKAAPKNSGTSNFGRAILMVALAVIVGGTGCQKEDELVPTGEIVVPRDLENTRIADFSNGKSYYMLDKNVSIEYALAELDRNALSAKDEAAGNISNRSNLPPLTFNVIKIDHKAAISLLPEYAVIVRSDGWVVYEGQRNVRVRDRVAFKIAISDMTVLHEIFERNKFYFIFPDFNDLPGLPVVYTTYRPNYFEEPRTIYDNYLDEPQRLITIRKSVETVLGIDRFVNKDWAATVNDPVF